jgi:uncharacterized protein with HEPN domain
MSYAAFEADAKTRRAVERCIEILSEAARRMPEDFHSHYPDIPWEDIKGIGNVLRHGYDKVDDRIIWTVIEPHLASLATTLAAISQDHDNDQSP